MCSVLGMVLTPIYPVIGTVVALGCFLVVAIDIARHFVWATLIGVMDQGATNNIPRIELEVLRALRF